MRPVNISAIALACLAFGTNEAATTEPTPKKAPCDSAATIRPVISTPYEGMLAPKSVATSGSRPMMTNSVVPMPKAPMASARRAADMSGLLLEVVL
ncbi:MAG TPA: hypothetical protein VFT31_17970 [Kribbella sp.]|nr:hypothetical protein [Kribbella sp.]